MVPYPVLVVIEDSDLQVYKYWSCGLEGFGHKHSCKRHASQCMARQMPGKKRGKKPAVALSDADRLKVLSRIRDGLTLRQLADELGITEGGAWMIVEKAKSIEGAQTSSDPFDRLSIRVHRLLMFEGLDTIEKVQSALKEGKLDEVPNLGAKSKREIFDWLQGIEAADGKP